MKYTIYNREFIVSDSVDRVWQLLSWGRAVENHKIYIKLALAPKKIWRGKGDYAFSYGATSSGGIYKLGKKAVGQYRSGLYVTRHNTKVTLLPMTDILKTLEVYYWMLSDPVGTIYDASDDTHYVMMPRKSGK